MVIPVAVAIIQRDGKILIAQRLPNKIYPGKWEFPGGKIESSETAEECLTREIQEEFGVPIIIGKPFLEWRYEYSDGREFQFCSFFCEIAGGELQLLAHSDSRWVRIEELRNFDLLDADKVLAEALQKRQPNKDEEEQT